MLTIAHDREVTLEQVAAVADGGRVALEPETAGLLDRRRAGVVNAIELSGQPAYGFNRGFGHNVDRAVPAGLLERLQADLIRSHAAGVGDPAPEEEVRAAMTLRAVSLARGHSGVGSAVVRQLIDLLNARITPVVPEYGSVGASGDLAPLSHIALALMGEGEVLAGADRRRMPAGTALVDAGLRPLALGMKEGLALNNGVQFSTGIGLLACLRLGTLLRSAAVTTAVSAQVLLGSDTAFRADLHRLRPHPGAVAVADWLARLMRDSPIRHSHEAYAVDWEVQDPYSIRCAAQVLGACHELISEAAASLRLEANSVTDNPVLLPAGDGFEIVSGGHFHGMPVAIRLYGLLQAAAIIASLANVRCARYVDEGRNKGLPADLIWPGLPHERRATASGMMIPEYVSAALTNAIAGACMPSHLLSIPTDAGQEDHVSMAGGLAVRLRGAVRRLAETIACELAFGSQAAAIRAADVTIPSKRTLSPEQVAATAAERQAYVAALKRELGDGSFDIDLAVRERYHWRPEERRLSPVCESVLARVRQVFPPVVEDRVLSGELQALAALVLSGGIVEAAGEGVWSSGG